MRTLVLSLLSLLGAALVSAATVGQPAPSFTLTDLQGKPVSLSSYAGKVVVLEWTNPECPFVVKHYDSGNLPRLQKQAAADGVVWLTINSGRPGAQGDFAPEQVKAWKERTGAAPAAYLRDSDGQVGRAYAAKTTPHLYVINAKGELAYAGAIDSIRSAKAEDVAKAQCYVTTALKAIAAGEPVKPAQTQAYGCSVKY